MEREHIFLGSKENRLIPRGVFGNLKNVVAGSFDENVIVPAEKGNVPKALLGVPIAVADTVLTAPDAALAGLAGEDIEPLKAQSFARTSRDIPLIVSHTLDTIANLLTLKPWQATKSFVKGGLGVLRLPSDIPMDIVNDATGVSVIERKQAHYHDKILALAA
ncbi:hypothetical protein A3A67_01065 [Candidatus Peribacteria bacterium RIFCSPLOWO2_01_FULL_51_18]|nr:MAG: hypothetical protein A3C52_02850 [Candidatus Peribacteria bacterium RIFCSPHIGHO2_02_FULL_51_15]OGJ66295.1 MAG: hypothetical protein A3A67_01065 [Candidatus Peribacteria bacterium RIFCSPLOWO2_01_FULL_51_18]OGJ67780.1 MAG: hypothetical protein A3J34_01270 [Candidatus Peribacteria bacterium RIFCSPLOWO2_02_FULL_51_10]